MFDKLKKDWQDTPVGQRWGFGGVTAIGVAAIALHAAFKPTKSPDAIRARVEADQTIPSDLDPSAIHVRNSLPDTNRNQGLEDLTLRLQKQDDKINELTKRLSASPDAGTVTAGRPGTQMGSTSMGSAAGPGPGAPSGPIDLDQLIPAPTFSSDQPMGQSSAHLHQSGLGGQSFSPQQAASAPEKPPAHMQVWGDSDGDEEDGDSATDALRHDAASDGPVVTLPVNAGIEAVALSGFNARPTGSVAGAVGGAQTAANNVGAPFVTRIKGDAILPNGWKLSDLGDCFLGGSAVAVLSTERAYAVADTLSCVKPNGEVYEGAVKAYALDVDGTLGIAGKVVSKQGSLLMQAALSGLASGLGSALSPTAIPAFNNSGSNGSTAGFQYPNLGAVGLTAAGQGVTQASAQLSKFYLQYASEVFPVVEVVAGTRVTWVLEKTVQLKRRQDDHEALR